MITILSAVVSILAFRLRSRASLELELIALRNQVSVLRRQHPGRPRFVSTDRLLWVWLYRVWPQGPQRHGAGQAGNRGPVASQRRPRLPVIVPLRRRFFMAKRGVEVRYMVCVAVPRPCAGAASALHLPDGQARERGWPP